ncbi:MAG: O-antigen ligase family protein, partial [Methanomassiliicoccales archaeon]
LILLLTPLNQLQQLDIPLFSSEIRIIGLITLVAFLTHYFMRKNIFIKKTELFLPLLVFVFAHIVGLFRASDVGYALERVISIVIYFILYILVVNLVKDEKTGKRMFVVLMLVTSGLAVFGIVQYFRGETLFSPDMGKFGSFDIAGQPVIRVIGVFRNPNAFAYTYVLVIPLTVGFFLIQKKRLYQCVLLALLGICTICLLLTFSRSAFLAVWISLFFILAVLKRSQKAMIAMGFLGISILLYAVSPDLFHILQFRVTSTSFDISIQERMALIGGGIETFSINPLIGSGTGNAPMILGKYAYRFIREAHNNLIVVLVETGLLGFVPFILIFIIFTKKMLHAMSKTSDRDSKIILVAILSSIWGYFINGLFHTSIAYGLWWFILGSGIAAADIIERYNQGNLTPLKQ